MRSVGMVHAFAASADAMVTDDNLAILSKEISTLFWTQIISSRPI